MPRAEKKFYNTELYETVAEKLNVPVHEVELIFMAQSNILLKVLKRSAFETVIFPYFGKFKASVKRLKKMNGTL